MILGRITGIKAHCNDPQQWIGVGPSLVYDVLVESKGLSGFQYKYRWRRFNYGPNLTPNLQVVAGPKLKVQKPINTPNKPKN